MNVHELLHSLSEERSVFHSEADFQHAFAWKIHETLPQAKIRLEYRPSPHNNEHLDIWVSTSEGANAFELKYTTGLFVAEIKGEKFHLANHAALDIRRYDFWKDVQRVESIVDSKSNVVGYALLLTNVKSYWNPGQKLDSVDESFRVHADRSVTGELKWAMHVAPGTIKGRDHSLHLKGEYTLKWQNYSNLEVPTNGQFRYLLIEISQDRFLSRA